MSDFNNMNNVLRNKSNFQIFINVLLILLAIGTGAIKAQTLLLPDTTFVCNVDSVELDAGPGFISYFWWETNEQTQIIWVQDTGWYHVSCDTAEFQLPVIDSTWVIFQKAGIVQDDTITVYECPITLCVEPDTLKYIWTSSNPNYIIEFDTAACIEVSPELDTSTFWVSITDSFDIITCIDSITIWLNLPLLPDTTLVCNADSVELDAGPGFINYFWWETAEQTQTIWVQDTGWYHVSCDTAELQPPVIDSTWVFFQKAGIVQDDTLTCYSYSIELCVEPDTLKYFWTSSDPDYVIEHDTAACIEVVTELDTTTFYVSITDSLDILTCVDSVTVWLYPRIRFDEVTQINTGCPGTCKGQLEVIVSGGKPPYSYLWLTSPNQYDSIAFGLCEQDYTLQVYDEFICIRDTVLPVEVYDMPEIEIIRDPEDKVYIQNPAVSFTFENNSIDSIQIIDWNWNFGDSTYSVEESPVKVFDQIREHDVWLKYTTSDECIDSVGIKIDIGQITLNIPNVMTPNGDGYNDTFRIDSLQHYMSNKIAIFNRYGKKVFSQTNYQGDWDGGNLRDGAYFYVLEAEGYFGTEKRRGSITIIRGY